MADALCTLALTFTTAQQYSCVSSHFTRREAGAQRGEMT